MAVTVLFPFQIIRQQATPLDVDQVFAITADRINYLSSPRRYAGQIVSDLEEGKAYILNTTRDGWLEIGTGGGGGSATPPIRFKVGDPDAPAAGTTVYTPGADVILNKEVVVFRSFVLQDWEDPGDGTGWVEKQLNSNSLTFHPALADGEKILILIF